MDFPLFALIAQVASEAVKHSDTVVITLGGLNLGGLALQGANMLRWSGKIDERLRGISEVFDTRLDALAERLERIERREDATWTARK